MRARDNPFAAGRVDRLRYRLDQADWEALIERLKENRWSGAIVGPHGSGKTTLLEEIGLRVAGRGLTVASVQLHSWRRQLPRIADADVMLCDGAEQLGWWDTMRLRWATRNRGLIVTSHRDGWLPTVHRCETSPQLLRELVSALGSQITEAEAKALHRQHAGNLRDALAVLYDRSAFIETVSSRSH
jgi:hypothetical protein